METLRLCILSFFLVCQVFATDVLRDQLVATWTSEQFAFTPAVRSAYLRHAKAQAVAEMGSREKELPTEFLAWVAANPLVEATVYGGHDQPADLLLHLYGLRLDLGRERFESYQQLALAAAIVLVKQAQPADITPRPPLSLQIGGDPRQPVETNTPERPLDKYDHIINFLNANSIEEKAIVGHKEAELKYDARGIAIKSKQKKVPIVEKKSRTLYAADVLASKELQAKFNAYMAEMGHPVNIDSGDRLIHWKSIDAVKGAAGKQVSAAYRLFREAYEAKGLLPKLRDPIPSIAERCRYIIRNYEHQFTGHTKREWPQFPITAPWPVLTLLVDDDQPLREREERWLAFRDKGEFRKMGEYLGPIAQQFDVQSARRLKPYPFTYNTVQMMLKDGGVCGTMASISVRSHIALGIPASQAIQPGHCALVSFQYDAKKDRFACVGGQYATGGHESTTPFARWYLGEAARQYRRPPGFGVPPNPRKPMVYHQSTAWAVNHGLPELLDALMAHRLYTQLAKAKREQGGLPLLMSGLDRNPYAFLLADAAQAAAATAIGQLEYWDVFSAKLRALGDSRGCPPDGLYASTVKRKVFGSLAKLPIPEDHDIQARVFAFLKAQNCDDPKSLIRYRLACEGLPAVLAATKAEFETHLVDTRRKADAANDAACKRMESAVNHTLACIKEKDAREAWALELWKEAAGHELYVGRWDRVSTDPAVRSLARQANQKMPDVGQLTQSYLDRLSDELKASIGGKRELGRCRELSGKIEAAAKFAKDHASRSEWIEGLAAIIAGHETFKPTKGKKQQRDPCADVIKRLA
ncbi:MAG: hypothetical protein ACI8W8_000567 [Rhodothermales bacterium]|jgi:hypothetical protein